MINQNENTFQVDRGSFIFIRHGQTYHNIRAEKAYHKYGQKYHDTQQYRGIKYDVALIDGNITEKGIQQALLAKQLMKNEQIDIVLVSPLRRALETCQIIFGERKDIKIYVQPIMCQYMSSAVDIGDCIKQSYEKYGKKFNFYKISPQHIQHRNWYLQLLNSNIRQLILEKKQKQNLPYHLATLEIIKTKKHLQTFIQMRKRVAKLKKILQKYSTSTDKKICIVGHGVLFTVLTTTQFSEESKSLNGRYFQNCVPEEVEILFSDSLQQKHQ